MEEGNQFSAVDFVVFGGMLLLSLVIGVYYAYKDRKKNSVENYYFGGRHLSPIPVGLSLAVTFISSLTVLGIPAHAYVYGTIVIWMAMSTVVQVTFACIYYIPMFHRLQLSSVYEYLELRYHRVIRLITSLFVVILMVMYMGTTIYLTSLAFTSVTPLSMALSVILTAGICTLYTTLRGMKAVVWNDTFQAGIMTAGVLALTIRVIQIVGGIDKVWESMERGERDTFWNFDPDPTLKHTVWTIMIGSGISWISLMCTNQAITQRCQRCTNIKNAVFLSLSIASMLGAVPMVLLKMLSAVTGCAMFAYYEKCDPVKSEKLEKVDQIVPYLVVEIFHDIPGMAGLFVSAAYSGMLSTVSSGINSLSALIMEDFLVPVKPNLSNVMKLSISKGLSVMFGVLITIIAFMAEYMGKTILQVVITLFGTFGGPILGIYTLGMHFPWTNTYGAGVGLIGGVTFSMWIALGAIIYQPKENGELPFSDEGCLNMTLMDSQTHFTTMEATIAFQDEHLNTRPMIADTLYSISYMYLAPLGMTMSMSLAALTTFITGKNDPEKMDPVLFLPLVDNKIFPDCIRKFFRFGVPDYQPELDTEKELPKLLKDNLLLKSDENSAKTLVEKNHLYEGTELDIIT